MATLSQLLAIPDLDLRLVQSGPEDPEINWVSTTELLDLGEYLEGGEIILTTGLALSTDDARWRDFVAGLSRARAAAIGFGVGVNHDRLPPSLVAAASAYRVALFEIPLPVPFIAVSRAIADLLRADELQSARNALQVQQRLLDGARGDQDPAEVLASIAQATGRQLALLASDGSTLASTAGFTALKEEAPPEVVELDPQGKLRLAIAGSEPLTPEGRSVVAAGSMVLGLGLRGARSDETRERERWERLTAALLEGPAAISSVTILNPRLELPERVRAIVVQGSAEHVGDWRRRPRSGLDRLVAPASEAPRAAGLGRAWQLCPDTGRALSHALAAAADHGLDAVVGRAEPLEEASLSRRSAATRLRSLSTTAPLYAEPRTPQVVWADRDAPVLESILGSHERSGAALAARVLGPLSTSVADSPSPDPLLTHAEREELCRTLIAVFSTDGQRGPAAAQLGIHRNTLRDRLARVERLTGRDLRDPDDRAELWIALRIEELRG